VEDVAGAIHRAITLPVWRNARDRMSGMRTQVREQTLRLGGLLLDELARNLARDRRRAPEGSPGSLRRRTQRLS